MCVHYCRDAGWPWPRDRAGRGLSSRGGRDAGAARRLVAARLAAPPLQHRGPHQHLPGVLVPHPRPLPVAQGHRAPSSAAPLQRILRWTDTTATAAAAPADINQVAAAAAPAERASAGPYPHPVAPHVLPSLPGNCPRACSNPASPAPAAIPEFFVTATTAPYPTPAAVAAASAAPDAAPATTTAAALPAAAESAVPSLLHSQS